MNNHANILGIGTILPRHGVTQAVSAAMSAPLCCRTEQEHRLFEVLYRRSRVKSRHSVLLSSSNGTGEKPGGNGNGNGDGDGTGHDDGHDNSHDHPLTQSFFQPAVDEFDHGPGTQLRMEQYAQSAGPLAAQAALAALNNAAINPAAIDHLITVSCTGFAAPGVDVALIRALGLRPDVTRTNVGFMGCHGAFNGLRTASALVRSGDQPERALVCAVELCSLHFSYGWEPQRIVANSLFADGAAAAVVANDVSADDGFKSRPTCRLLANGSTILPDSTDAMTWRITDHGFEMTLSPRVPDLIRTHLKEWLTAWLARFDLTIDRVAAWAVHPGGPRILQSVHEALALPPGALDESHAVLADCGNMSSPTILFILERLRRAGVAAPCVALGFGPGLAVEAMLIG